MSTSWAALKVAKSMDDVDEGVIGDDTTRLTATNNNKHTPRSDKHERSEMHATLRPQASRTFFLGMTTRPRPVSSERTPPPRPRRRRKIGVAQHDHGSWSGGNGIHTYTQLSWLLGFLTGSDCIFWWGPAEYSTAFFGTVAGGIIWATAGAALSFFCSGSFFEFEFEPRGFEGCCW